MGRRCYTGLMVLALVGIAAPVRAQTMVAEADLNQLSIEQLANVEVTSASRRPEPLSKAAASIFVITADDIRRSGAVNLPEALRLAPNLEVVRMNGYAYTVSARGFSSPESANKLLVMVDGRSVYSPLASTVFWENLDVPLADIERIEVVSGPGGTLYGANAVNGVINIVTKNAADTQGGLLDAGAGTTDDRAMARYGVTPWEGGSARIYAGTSRSNNTVPQSAADATRTAWVRDEGGFRFDQKLDADSFSLEGQIYANTSPEMALERGRGDNLNAHWSHAFESGSALELQASADESVRILPDSTQREQLTTDDLQVQHNTSLGWDDSFIYGGEYRRFKEFYYIPPGPFGFADPTTTISVGNIFAQDEVPLAANLKLTLGAKGEDNSYSGFDFMPNLRLAWSLSDTDMLWAAVSRAVRTPSKVDRELESPGILLPSPNFASEKLTAYEAGYRGVPLPQLSFSASFYYNVYDSLRSDQYTPVTVFPITLENGTAGSNYGAEVWGKYALTDWWRLSAGFSWLHKGLRIQPGFTDLANGQSGGQDPASQAQLRSQMNVLDNLDVDLGLRSVSKVTQENPTTGAQIFLVPSYVEADARIGWRPFGGTEISLDGFNLIHQRHLEANDPSTFAPQYVPRSFLLTLRQSF